MNTNPENKKKAGSKLIPILAFIAVILAVALYGFFFLNQQDNIIQGEAEVTEVRISSKVPGRIARFLVEEGDFVKKGDTLAILSAPDVDAKYYQALAAEEGAEAQNEKAIRGARPEEKQGAYELWQKAVAGVELARITYLRVQNLYDKGVTTAQKRDEAEANYKAAVATERAAKSQYDMAVNGTQREDKLAAGSAVERARGAVAEVESYIEETYLISPLDGEVSERFPNVGELVGTGAPVMNIMNINDKWGTFNVREDRLIGFKMGETITAYIPAIDKDITMKIYYMKDLGTYAAWKATKITGSYDRKTFEVRAHFLENNKDIRPGMSLIIRE